MNPKIKRIITSLIVYAMMQCGLYAQSASYVGNAIQYHFPQDNNDLINVNSNTYIYTARDKITLKEGFHYKATGYQHFKGSIDESLIFNMTPPVEIVNPSSFAQGNTVGKIDGAFNVSESGAANYSIPIAIPVGTANMQPSLSIGYSSQGGFGLLGMKWDISGFSSITRSPNPYYLTNSVKEIDLTASDWFNMDGNTLIAQSAGIYKTEIESYSKIEAIGNGPDYFKVTTKDGLIMEYGNTEDSKLQLTGGTLIWKVNRITDLNHNFIDFKYFSETGETFIEQINYTGNVEAGLQPYNTIKFIYERRTDKKSFYVAGNEVKNTVALKEIIARSNDLLFRKYEFEYECNLFTRLRVVNEYGSNGEKLNGTVINWFKWNNSFGYPNRVNFGRPCINMTGDFDGDGKSEVISFPNKTPDHFSAIDSYIIYKAEQENQSIAIASGFLSNYFSPNTCKVADFDGDGKDEILFTNVIPCNNGSGGSLLDYEIKKLVGGNLITYSYGSMQLCNFHDIFVGDFNGDSKADWAIQQKSGSTYNFNIMTLGSSNTPIASSGWIYTGDHVYPLDFNGDGATDLLCTKDLSLQSYVYTFKDGHIQAINNSIGIDKPNGFDKIFPGDFNGDGKADILKFKGVWKIQFSTGLGWSSEIDAPSGMPNIDPVENTSSIHVETSDFNSDGISDILEVHNDGSDLKLNVYYYNGKNGFVSELNTMDYYTQINRYAFITGDFEGDGKSKLLYMFNDVTATKLVRFGKNVTSNLVSSIKNGFGQELQIEYNTITQMSDYTPSTGAIFPINDFSGPVYVVKKTTLIRDVVNKSMNFTYSGAKLHRQGKGFLNFQSIISTDEATGFVTTNTYELKLHPSNNKVCGNVLKKSETLKGTKNISSNENTNSVITNTADNRIYQIRLTNSTSKDINDVITLTPLISYDNSGNITYSITSVGGDVSKSVSYEYTSVGGIGFDNRMTKQTVSTTYLNSPPFDVSTKYEYDASFGYLKKQTDFDGLSKKTETTYSNFNACGLAKLVTTTGSGLFAVPTINNDIEYDGKYRFVTSTKNSLGQVSKKSYNDFGNVLTETGIDNLTTRHIYDGFGRLLQSTTPEGYVISNTYSWESNASIQSLYSVSTTASGRPDAKTWYDDLGRVVKTETEAFSGKVTVEKIYENTFDKLWMETLPYYPGENKKWTTYGYDATTSILSSVETLGQSTSYSVSGLTTTITKPDGNMITKTTNAAGKVLSSTDENGTINYKYHSSGQPKEITVSAPQTSTTSITMQYDDCGRQTELHDPNSGITSYEYDAYGKLRSQTDQNLNTYTMDYNVLGQITSKTGSDGNLIYSYYTAGTEINKLQSEIHSGGASNQYQYGAFGRLRSFTENIQGQPFTTSYEYDNYGNVTKTTYPSSTLFAIKYVYIGKSFLSEIHRQDNDAKIWKRVEETNLSRKYELGDNLLENKYVYDNNTRMLNAITTKNHSIPNLVNYFQYSYYNFDPSTGNLEWRKDNKRNMQENFEYDNDRLKKATIGQIDLYTAAFKPNGNIDTKSDAGTYVYHPVQLNAVSEIKNITGSFPSDDQTLTYTKFNKVETIIEGVNAFSYALQYDVNQQRNYSVLSNHGQPVKTKFYATGYEKEVIPTGTRELHYISGTNGVAAVYIIENGTGSMHYVLKDHLGSVTGLVNETGQLAHEYSYDAWGRMRNPVDYTDYSVPQNTLIGRGYTGHEHLPEFGLINMNGRVYDPQLGRFLSPDNFVQDPSNTQCYNRFSYCLNNPLKYTDPSGEFIPLLIGAAWTIAMSGDAMGNAYVRSGRGSYNQGFWRGAAIGGSTIVLGVGAGALGAAIGASSAAIPGALYGAVSGGVIGGYAGAMSAASLGTSISNGFWQGALMGAVSGAVMGGIMGYREGGERWLLDRRETSFSEISPEQMAGLGETPYASNEEYYNSIGFESGDNGANKIDLFNNPNSDSKYTYKRNANNTILAKNTKTGEVKLLGGATQYKGNRIFGYRSADIYVSQFKSGYDNVLNQVVNHEFEHAWLWQQYGLQGIESMSIMVETLSTNPTFRANPGPMFPPKLIPIY